MPLEDNFDPNAPQPQPFSESQPRSNEPPRERGPNNLPEAHDKTTEQISSLSNFNVSDALGLPLLTKDIKTNGSQPRDRESNSGFLADHGGSGTGYFGLFSQRDRLVACASAIMILGPLFFGMMRG